MAILPGEIYWGLVGGKFRPVIVVSREPLNRGRYLLAVPTTTQRLDERRTLPNCVHFMAGAFGLDRECVAQGEAMIQIGVGALDLPRGRIGMLSSSAFAELTKAIGYAIGADCKPTTC